MNCIPKDATLTPALTFLFCFILRRVNKADFLTAGQISVRVPYHFFGFWAEYCHLSETTGIFLIYTEKKLNRNSCDVM